MFLFLSSSNLRQSPPRRILSTASTMLRADSAHRNWDSSGQSKGVRNPSTCRSSSSLTQIIVGDPRKDHHFYHPLFDAYQPITSSHLPTFPSSHRPRYGRHWVTPVTSSLGIWQGWIASWKKKRGSLFSKGKPQLIGGWTNPNWKILISQIGSFFQGKNPNIWNRGFFFMLPRHPAIPP